MWITYNGRDKTGCNGVCRRYHSSGYNKAVRAETIECGRLGSGSVRARAGSGKCEALCVSFKSSKHGIRLKTVLTIRGKPIKTLAAGEMKTFLGRNIGLEDSVDANCIVNKMVTLGRSIEKSELYSWQKLDAMDLFVYPKLDYTLRVTSITKTSLQEGNCVLSGIVSSIADLPTYVPIE